MTASMARTTMANRLWFELDIQGSGFGLDIQGSRWTFKVQAGNSRIELNIQGSRFKLDSKSQGRAGLMTLSLGYKM